MESCWFDSNHTQHGLPCGSDSKESTCNEEDFGSIPGLERSPGEGIGYPLQFSWASLVAPMVKNLPTMHILELERSLVYNSLFFFLTYFTLYKSL